MTPVLLLGGLALLLVVLAVVRTIRADGYGTRTPPASHAPWWDADGSPSPEGHAARR